MLSVYPVLNKMRVLSALMDQSWRVRCFPFFTVCTGCLSNKMLYSSRLQPTLASIRALSLATRYFYGAVCMYVWENYYHNKAHYSDYLWLNRWYLYSVFFPIHILNIELKRSGYNQQQLCIVRKSNLRQSFVLL